MQFINHYVVFVVVVVVVVLIRMQKKFTTNISTTDSIIDVSMKGEQGTLQIISDLGLGRSIHSAFQLAKLILSSNNPVVKRKI